MESKWSRDAHIAGLTSQSSARLRDLPPGISNAFVITRIAGKAILTAAEDGIHLVA
jgi:hypothetical protein